MAKHSQKTTNIQLDDSLIESANEYLESLPKTAFEVIERWAWIGKAASEQLTEKELILLQLRNDDVKIVVKPKE